MAPTSVRHQRKQGRRPSLTEPLIISWYGNACHHDCVWKTSLHSCLASAWLLHACNASVQAVKDAITEFLIILHPDAFFYCHWELVFPKNENPRKKGSCVAGNHARYGLIQRNTNAVEEILETASKQRHRNHLNSVIDRSGSAANTAGSGGRPAYASGHKGTIITVPRASGTSLTMCAGAECEESHYSLSLEHTTRAHNCIGPTDTYKAHCEF